MEKELTLQERIDLAKSQGFITIEVINTNPNYKQEAIRPTSKFKAMKSQMIADSEWVRSFGGVEKMLDFLKIPTHTND